MATPRTFILIKNEPKALQIEKFALCDNGVYEVKFKSSPNTYHYRGSDVVWIKESQWHDHLHCKVYIGVRELKNVSDIRSFTNGNHTHWRITFSSGAVRDYKHGTIHVAESCLADEVARNSFEYLKRIAQTNDLGKDEEHGGILPSLYEKIDFIDKSLAIAPYLYPEKNKVRLTKSPSLIFPFGCNASQEKAVKAAFSHQISVIQGPPGTGKTQTILNIIANILVQGKTVMVVSNNNSATKNVQEKLKKYGLDFVVAALGKRENKERFIQDQAQLPNELDSWELDIKESVEKKRKTSAILSKLKKIFALQEELAISKQEIKAVELEWCHFKEDNSVDEKTYSVKSGVKSKLIMSIWLKYQAYVEGEHVVGTSFWARLIERIKWAWLNFTRTHRLGIKSELNPQNLNSIVLELQALYYQTRIKELEQRINALESELAMWDARSLNQDLASVSMEILKNALYGKYHKQDWITFSDVKEIGEMAEDVLKQYPVVLSTTFSARTCLSDSVEFDYLIMDEASQVSIETGALAMMCAKNAVIVGDTLQLSNVVTDEDKCKLGVIFDEYKVAPGYNSAEYSFLQSICTVIPNIEQTLLREHYRCHPRIINFCNQRFYGDNLLIMTEDKSEDGVMMAIKTVPGHHCRGHYNQREIDVVKKEVLPSLSDASDVGIITPYNSQVEEFLRQLPAIETATIHKYQGREKDTIIMSVVDDLITDFTDDPNLLNVAISRAKKKFCIVLSGNEQKLKGNISELVDYIDYNNFTVVESKISSIFDYLYSQYTEQRLAYLSTSKNISEFDSENLTYKLLVDIVSEYPEFNHLGVLCHTPIRSFIRDWSLMSEEERRYVSHYTTHLDFLLINHVSKKAVLAIETDGFNFHNEITEQHGRDMMKDHILSSYGLPLLRLSTTGSGEHDKVVAKLREIVH